MDSKDVNLSSFKIKEELHPKFWSDGKLSSRVRLRLMDIADDFIKELSVDWVKPKDVILTGSIANYNWSRYSDVDIHVIVDFKKVYPRKTEFVDDYFKAKREIWNDEHEDLKIFGFPIEISVEDSNVSNPSSGRYSLYKNKWIAEPDDFQDATINQEFVKKKAMEIMTQLDGLEKRLSNEDDKVRCGKYGNKAHKIFDKLRKMRSDGLTSSKREMSSGNIIYKIIRRAGYLDKIWEIVNLGYDKANSIDERKAINEAQSKGKSFSAGIIPFRMNSRGKTEVFLGLPGKPKDKDFDPPAWMERYQILKGHMEKGEDPMECAIREFCEESGVPKSKVERRKLISLGTQRISPTRNLVCYGLDMTGRKTFDNVHFHANLIDSDKYIELNGGKPYEEMSKYSWKKIDDIELSTLYEIAFYKKCDEICQSIHGKDGKK